MMQRILHTMGPESRIYIAGHSGLVGSAIVRRLQEQGFHNLLLPRRSELDLTRQDDVERFFGSEKPEYVFMAAARVGGILANDTYPADFIRDNALIEMLMLDAAHRHGTERVLFLGSSCIYPKHAPQPMKEEYLLTGLLEPTNEAYAIAKILGIKAVEAYRRQHGVRWISAMPTNLYGPNDNFDLQTSHVLPAFIRRFHEAKEGEAASVTVWGSGTPRREFLHVDDLADALVFLMQNYDGEGFVNIGVGEDVTIRELAELVRRVVGYEGTIEFDTSKPDGTPRKLMDVSRLTQLGWRARIGLEEGIRLTYDWYRGSLDSEGSLPGARAAV
ncbi:MAG TPA: GDP-L-fucose synthase [Longimicrobiales bacterium]|nr:GDP-L-fucose synthase [Longimicrobiales bacterium]